MKQTALMRKQLDRQFEKWRPLTAYRRPTKGWVQAIRKALGMTAKQLAKRAGVHRMRIVQLERAEPDDAITLRTLRTIASHLNCELIYALVPRTPLQTTLEQQAVTIAKQRIKTIAHTMALENQAISQKQLKEQLNALIKKLNEGSPKHLWDD